MTVAVQDLLVLAGIFFIFYVMKSLFDIWFKKTNRVYVTEERCAHNREKCTQHQVDINKKLLQQINTLKVITFKIAIKLGIDEDEVKGMLEVDIDG